VVAVLIRNGVQISSGNVHDALASRSRSGRSTQGATCVRLANGRLHKDRVGQMRSVALPSGIDLPIGLRKVTLGGAACALS